MSHMFAGHRCAASDALYRAVLDSAKKALAPGFTWKYGSELKMLAVLEDKTQQVVDESLVGFVDLPTSSWRFVTQKGDTKFPSDKISDIAVAKFSSLWENQNKHFQRKMKALKSELFKEFNLIENTWRQRDYEPSTKKIRRRKSSKTS